MHAYNMLELLKALVPISNLPIISQLFYKNLEGKFYREISCSLVKYQYPKYNHAWMLLLYVLTLVNIFTVCFMHEH